MRQILIKFGAAAALVLTACGNQGTETTEIVEPPLTGATIGGEFTLTDHMGKQFSNASLNGQYRLLYFGYSYCPDVCPLDLQKLSAGLRSLEKSNPDLAMKIQPLFVTIDPERDTAEQLAQYVPNFHPRLIGLTGTAEQIKRVADLYLISYQRRELEDSEDYLMDHSTQSYLMGPDGLPIALIPHDPQIKATEIAMEMKRWIR